MPDFTVAPRGVDTSGRAILMSQFMADWWQACVDRLDWEPVIVQGAWMSRIPGGGASASAGYHDMGGCLDIRTHDLTTAKIDQLVRVLRRHGAAAWRRDQQHGGMDPHLHLVLGTDADLASGAKAQWADYKAGGNGLTGDSAGPDYEWRPSPLVTTPPEEMFMPTAEEIAHAVWSRQIAPVGSDTKITAAQMLRQIHNRTAGIKPLAAAVAQVDPSIDQAALERALAKVLGSLDE